MLSFSKFEKIGEWHGKLPVYPSLPTINCLGRFPSLIRINNVVNVRETDFQKNWLPKLGFWWSVSTQIITKKWLENFRVGEVCLLPIIFTNSS